MIQFLSQSFPDQPGLDTGISHALVRHVGEGVRPETFRLHRTGPVVAFGRQDRTTAGYRHAVLASRDAGYLPIERLAGGRAAVFHEDTLAFSWAIPTDEPRAGISERFETISSLLARAFADVGVPSRVGELPGEYCPGSWSVHAVGGGKVMGVGQRLVRGAAHVGGVVVVDGGRRIADVLVPVYAALGIEWDPRTSGDLNDHADVDEASIRAAIRSRLEERNEVRDTELDPDLIAAGEALAAGHVAVA